MKWLIASDLHGSEKTCKALLAAFEREEADRILFLGDLLYHGPRNDLPEAYAPKQVIALLNEKKDSFFCVRGNCDTEVDQMVLEFPILADYAIIPLGNRTIFATHGHHFHAKALPNLKKGDVLLHGHTHIPIWEEHEGIYVFNPGSATIPKGGSEKGYMILEENTFRWKTLDGKEFHSITL
jgi:putative phosphoesterase